MPDADAEVPREQHDAQECERGEEVVVGVDERKRDEEMDVSLNQDGLDRHVEEWVLLLDGYVERDDLAGVILVVPCHWQKKMGNLVDIRENGLLAVDHDASLGRSKDRAMDIHEDEMVEGHVHNVNDVVDN